MARRAASGVGRAPLLAVRRACSTSASKSARSSPASGCQSTPTANRFSGSSSASTVPSSAHATSRSPSPMRPVALVVMRLDRRALAEELAELRRRLDAHVVVGEDARRVLVPLVADDLGQVLDEVAAARDVQHLRAAADGEHRHVALERALEQRSSPRSRSGTRARRLRVRDPGRTSPGRGRCRRRRAGRRARRASPRAPRRSAGRAARDRPRARSPRRTCPGRARTARPTRPTARARRRS